MISLQPLYDLGRPFWFAVLGFLLLAFFVTDCVGGETQHYTGHISGRSYTPPSTTPGYWDKGSTTCTGEGKKKRCTTTPAVYHPPVYHPPHWYMVVSSQEGSQHFEIDQQEYHSLQIGKSVPLTCQVGCYTGWHYPGSRK